jgi:hypothetical protein
MKNKEKKNNPIPVRLKPTVREALDKLRQQEDRSLNYFINKAVEQFTGKK